MTSKMIKEKAAEFGANLCGIAPADRFKNAPEGFSPLDLYPECKSVIVFAKRLPVGLLNSTSCVPYSHYNSFLFKEVDRISLKLAYYLEDMGHAAIPLPSDDPYEHWEPARMYGRAILSMRHAAYLAGLGIMGKNTLVINEEYGNMILIGAVLTNINLEADPIIDNTELCPENCTLCIDSCPVDALDSTTVNQQKCRPRSIVTNEKGYTLYKCNICREICPSGKGTIFAKK
ncbi:MAG: epoxyqueuosine reductase [Promethearchaeota archaeon]